MPDQPKTPHRTIRFPDDVWHEFGQAAEAQGTDRSKLLNDFALWYVRRPKARLPKRPAAQDADQPG